MRDISTLALGTPSSCLFFFNDTATTEIYTLSLHDALPISPCLNCLEAVKKPPPVAFKVMCLLPEARSEERFSRNAETDIVCRLLLEKKKQQQQHTAIHTVMPQIDRPPRVVQPA